MITIVCSCGSARDVYTDRNLDGPDGEVVVFIADADDKCSHCGITLRHLLENEAMAEVDPEDRACICTDADDPNDHRTDCPQWRVGRVSA